jgi:signal peptidase I
MSENNMELKKINPFYWVNRFNEWIDKKHWFLQIVILLSLIFTVRTFVFGLYWVPTGSMEPTILVGESFFADKFTPLFTDIKRGEIVSFNAPNYIYSENFFIRLFEEYVYGPDNWTKRVIGIPGDRVEGKIINGRTFIYLNGQELDEPYINPYPIVKVKEEAWQLCKNIPGINNVDLVSIPFMKKVTSSKYRVFDPQFPIDSVEQPFYNLYLEEKLPNAQRPSILYPRTPYPNSSINDVFDVVLGEDEYWCMGDNRLGSYDSRGFGRVFRKMIHGRIIFRLFSLKSANSIIYDCLLMPLYVVYMHFKNLSRSWDRYFCKIK